MNEITIVSKVSRDGWDYFEYRDMYNDCKTVQFPSSWNLNDDEVVDYLTNL